MTFTRANKIRRAPLVLIASLILPAALAAQGSTAPQEKTDTAIHTVRPKEKKITLSGMLILRYTASLDKQVDVNGNHHATTGQYTTNAFALRRARVQAKAQLSPRAEAAVLLNLTDFTGDPKNKVLETATLKYRFSDYCVVQAGQFRPYFGREDLYPEEQLHTLEWSNSYYAFGANGWQSFQVGATVYGKAIIAHLPVRYYVGVFNGNGRNQVADNDNGKLFPARLEIGVLPKAVLGLNGGIGKEEGRRVWAAGTDLNYTMAFGNRWEAALQSEYKWGTNHALFCTATEEGKIMDDYRLRGFYVLPHLAYTLNKEEGRRAELSMRYEKVNTDYKRAGNRRITCIPMIGLQTGGCCTLRAGLLINRYARDVEGTNEYSHTRFVCQAVAKF